MTELQNLSRAAAASMAGMYFTGALVWDDGTGTAINIVAHYAFGGDLLKITA